MLNALCRLLSLLRQSDIDDPYRNSVKEKVKMRIGFIPGPLDTLSGEHFPHFVHMKENLKALEKQAEIDLIVADKANAEYVRFRETEAYSLLNRTCMHFLRKVFHIVFFLAVYLEVKRSIEPKRDDVFIIRFSFANYFITRHLWMKGCKILLEVHALAHIEEKEYGQTWAPPFYTVIVRYLEREMLGFAHQIIVVSESLKNSLVAFGIDEARIHVIHNAIDPDVFDYTTNPGKVIKKLRLENRIVVGFVGSFARYHGIELLVDMARQINRRYGDVHFLLVGKNVHGTDNIVEGISGSEIASIFTFTGEVPHSKIPSYIAAMDIAIIPDFNDYGSPMKLFEYMAMGKPTVAPDVPPIREVVEQGRTALLFEKKNVGDAIFCIETLIRDKRLRHQMGKRARDATLNSHTWDRNAEKIVSIAEQMI